MKIRKITDFIKSNKTVAITLTATLVLSACGLADSAKNNTSNTASIEKSTGSDLNLAYESFTLKNGLKVILHQDKSDPIVAISTIVHVGSNREKPGRTGFAHFFEHMSFNDSENVPKGSNRKLIPELGGSRNGGTWSDGTIYYEVVPKDAFDKLLWIDSDRLGFMINTVDQGTLEREKQVVKNEKRQRVDNRPYGHTGHVIKKALYPEGHPYNWTVIGDLADLQAATLDDVREFYSTFYVPSNATMVIAGDFELEETKEKVKRWFGEIKAGKAMAAMSPQPVTLKETKKLYHLDNFAKLPEIRVTFPTVEQYHKDSYALDALAEILSSGKQAPLYKTIVEDKKLAPGVYAWNSSEEIAGTFTLLVRGNVGTQLDVIYQAIEESLTAFEKNGFTLQQLIKIKAEQETSFYYEIESILDKAQKLGQYNEYAGSPEFIKADIANITAVSIADVKRVFQTYIKNKNSIITSFVPKDQIDLIVSGSKKADVVEEKIEQGKEEKFAENDAITFEVTPTVHDRSEPALTALPTLNVPDVWQNVQSNGLKVYGIEQNELPIVNFSLTIQGGQQLDLDNKRGTAGLMAQLMNEGTLTKTPQELEEAIGLLGANLRISSNREFVTISGRSLAKNFDATVDLLSEMLLTPRWQESEFSRLKSTRLTRIKQAKGNANTIANNVFNKLLYSEKHVAGNPIGGTEHTVGNITLNDTKQYYQHNISPKMASFHVVGAVNESQVNKALTSLNNWQGDKVKLPKQPTITERDKPQFYFIDVADAKQSVIMVGKPVVSGQNADFYPIQVANNRLGGGMSGRLAQTLRIQKGYTYGAYSSIRGASYQSPFIASSQVRTNVTLESLEIFKSLISEYKNSFTEEDLAVTQNMIIKGNSRKFETLDQLLGMLTTMSQFDLAANYIDQQQNYVTGLKLDNIHKNIDQYFDEQSMIYLVVGDAKTQLARMKDFGYGEPIVLNTDGEQMH
ncbi:MULTISPECIES: M16 family metallopeptidase [unclassified Colwellia]|uniref:M16 family metallopeptidase n=1 Tax=unclassified Colwellia TaxID=196834 RepID=UPI0015F44191|nr:MULTISPECIES: pitrilysin family protein [unclassified Colwellia]MBA6232502.1 insulinase family protein [Colwellia sp. MB02u-7]MBA6237660.1 insulinase family protein [Colwellia sp. MB02u-11]MBA6255353.1 insulinase family protein [Colwellia sp. MB3u-28]MBA6261493.1 insulinase family protein [Colwellia sp. MB3u-41]MBA6299407.1 insulinase family protein [Colwellia sp. MB3u-22]